MPGRANVAVNQKRPNRHPFGKGSRKNISYTTHSATQATTRTTRTTIPMKKATPHTNTTETTKPTTLLSSPRHRESFGEIMREGESVIMHLGEILASYVGQEKAIVLMW